MNLGLLTSVGLLGLAAVDPVGIAAMPLLLSQSRGIQRAVAFLAGSCVALLLMGLAFTQGFGRVILATEERLPWLVPGLELAAGLILVVTAVVLWLRGRSGRSDAEPSDAMRQRLQAPPVLLFGFGFVLVVVQSLIDVVFIVAMANVGQLRLPIVESAVAVATYTIGALLLQVLILLAYVATPREQREAQLARLAGWLHRHATTIAVTVSGVLGVALAINGISGLRGGPTFI